MAMSSSLVLLIVATSFHLFACGQYRHVLCQPFRYQGNGNEGIDHLVIAALAAFSLNLHTFNLLTEGVSFAPHLVWKDGEAGERMGSKNFVKICRPPERRRQNGDR